MQESASTSGNKAGAWQKIERAHPHKMLIILSVIGSTLLFAFMIIALSSAFQRADVALNIRMPKFFTISSFLILISSFYLLRVPPAYQQDDMATVVQNLKRTLWFGLGFGLSQLIGWQELDMSGIKLAGNSVGSYIYMLSGLHLLHMVGGVIFVSVLYRTAQKAKQDAVKSFIYLANPYEKVRLEMLSIWWHFMDILWLVFFFYFLIISN